MNIVYREWLNRNASRIFPFEASSNLSCEGNLVLPSDFFLDARACLLDESYSWVKICKVDTSNNCMTVDFSIGPDIMLSETVGADGVLRHRSHNADVRIVCTPYSELGEDEKDKVYMLSTPAEILKTRVVRIPWGFGVDRLVCNGVSATGNVRLEDGHNTRLMLKQDAFDELESKVLLEIGIGLGKGLICMEKPKSTEIRNENGSLTGLRDPEGMPPIYYICGQKADSDGGFQIYAGEGVVINTGTKFGMPTIEVKTSAAVEAMAVADSMVNTNK